MSAPHAPPQRPATVELDLHPLRDLAVRLADLDAGTPSAVNHGNAPRTGGALSSSTASRR